MKHNCYLCGKEFERNELKNHAIRAIDNNGNNLEIYRVRTGENEHIVCIDCIRAIFFGVMLNEDKNVAQMFPDITMQFYTTENDDDESMYFYAPQSDEE